MAAAAQKPGGGSARAGSGQDDGKAGEDRRLGPLEGPEAAGGLVEPAAGSSPS